MQYYSAKSNRYRIIGNIGDIKKPWIFRYENIAFECLAIKSQARIEFYCLLI